ncbi:MAG: CapA family protein [Lachnospiraceae bacterium]|jgi:poly-gamma-glutamate synthesis protein (capsule biosynthesis protein)|nr:CapA family protein [Lachnospiraceae bacterium]
MKKKRLLLVFAATFTAVLSVGLIAFFVYLQVLRVDAPANTVVEEPSPTVERVENSGTDGLTDAVNNPAGNPTSDPAGPGEDPETPPGRYADELADLQYMAENRIYYREPAVEGEARLLFGGDFLFDQNYATMSSAIRRGGTVDVAFSEDLLEMMRGADVTMLNNEFTYTTRGEPVPHKMYTFRAKPETAAWLPDMGVDIVSLANNHTFDFGEISLLDTLDTLVAHGVRYVGAGRSINEAAAPAYFIVGDIKIALIASTQIEREDNPDTRGASEFLPGVFRFRPNTRLLAAIKDAKENSDFVIVFVHWGTENESAPDWSQLQEGPQIAAAGADLIVGSHSHVLQGIYYYGETPVVHSLGNFWFSSRTYDTGVLEVIVNEEGLKSLRFIPAIQKDCVTSVLHDSEKKRVLDTMRGLSKDVEIDEDGYIIR